MLVSGLVLSTMKTKSLNLNKFVRGAVNTIAGTEMNTTGGVGVLNV
jgi:hypothetical protein